MRKLNLARAAYALASAGMLMQFGCGEGFWGYFGLGTIIGVGASALGYAINSPL